MKKKDQSPRPTKTEWQLKMDQIFEDPKSINWYVMGELLTRVTEMHETHYWDMRGPLALAMRVLDRGELRLIDGARALEILSLCDEELSDKERGRLNEKYGRKIGREMRRHWRQVAKQGKKWFKEQSDMRKEWKRLGWD